MMYLVQRLFQRGYIQNILALIIWFPIIGGILYYFIAPEGLFYENIVQRIIPYAIPPLLTTITCLSLATFSFLKGSRHLVTTLFGIYCALYGLLSADIFFASVVTSEKLSITVNRLDHILFVFLPAVGLHSIYLIVDRKNDLFIYCNYALSLFLLTITQTDQYMYSTMYKYYWGFFARGNWGFQLFSVCSSATTLWSIILVVLALKKEKDENQNKRLLFILLGYLLSAFVTLGNIPAMNGIEIYPSGNFVFLTILITAYGVFRHDLIRINLYAKKRIIGWAIKFFVTTGFLVLVPFIYWALRSYDFKTVAEGIVPYGIPPLISFLMCAFLAFLSLRIGENQKESLIFSILCLFYTYLTVDILLLGIIRDDTVCLQISRWDHIFVVFIPGLMLHLTHVVSDRRKGFWVICVIYAIGVGLSIFTPSELYFSGLYHYYWGYFAKKAVLWDVMSGMLVFSIIYASIVLLSAYRKAPNPFQKYRRLFLLLGIVSIGIFSAGNLPAMNGIEIYPATNFIFVPFTLFAMGMFRHNRREALRLSQVILFYCGFILLIIGMTWVILRIRGASFLIHSAVLTAVIITAFLFNRLWHDALTVIFRREKLDLAATYEDLLDVLSKHRTIHEIAETIGPEICSSINSLTCIVVFYEKEKAAYSGLKFINPRKGIFISTPMDEPKKITIAEDYPLIALFSDHNIPVSIEHLEEMILNKNISVPHNDYIRAAALIQSVLYKERLTAFIMLGPKTDGTIYSNEEKKFIHNLGVALGPYIENAFIYESLEKMVGQRTEELNKTNIELLQKSEQLSWANTKIENDMSIIIERNTVIERDLEVARLLQRRLLPEVIIDREGYRSHAEYIPMDKVGGDFYDCTSRGRYLDFFIADVSGHGLIGAFLGMLTKMALESITDRRHTNMVLIDLNRVICKSTVQNHFVTAFFCVLDTETNMFHFSSAGHQPPLLFQRATGECVMLTSSGKPLGWFENIIIEEKAIQLASGDRLMLYTDGIIECRDPSGEFFGDERLVDFITASRDVTPEECAKLLVKKLREFSAHTIFEDDLSMVIIDIL